MAGYQFQRIGHQVQDRKQYLCFQLHCVQGKMRKSHPVPLSLVQDESLSYVCMYAYVYIYMYVTHTHTHLPVSHLTGISLADWPCSIVIFGFTEPLFYLIMVTNSRWVMPVTVLCYIIGSTRHLFKDLVCFPLQIKSIYSHRKGHFSCWY